jgi:poly-gamma-glutamate capsule biosynthesis protein CapA/YwtB (metallophosphatase superfamily)
MERGFPPRREYERDMRSLRRHRRVAFAVGVGLASASVLTWGVAFAEVEPVDPTVTSTLPRWRAPGGILVVRGTATPGETVTLFVGSRKRTAAAANGGVFRFRVRAPSVEGLYAVAVEVARVPVVRLDLGRFRVRPARITAVGDVNLGDRPGVAITTYGARYPWLSAARVLRAADVAIANLECSISTRGYPIPGKQYTFRAAPSSLKEMARYAGVDTVTVANNHALDYGQVGLLDTLAAADAADYPIFGAGRTADDAYAPWITEVKGVKIAVLGMSQVAELSAQWKPTDSRPGIAMAFDPARASAAVKAARAQADLVIVFMHWGIEGSSCPSGQMKSFAQRMARDGADIVLGTHAHTLLTDGWIDDTYVHFGLGNFLWYGDSHSTDSGVLKLTVRDRSVIRNEFLPATVSGTGQPKLVSGNAKKRIQDKLKAAKRCTGLAAAPA